MANNAATLNTKLATALRDTTYATWGTGEIDDLIAWSVSRLFATGFSRPIDPSVSGGQITIAADTYWYALPSGVNAVSRIDLLDTSGNELGPISGRAWEITGDVLNGTGKLHISPQIVSSSVGAKLMLHGYAHYDVTTNLIPDDLVPLVLARARAEAYRRVAADRERFKAWLARNQVQNVSVNEMLQMINEADAEAAQLERRTQRTWMKPVSGRVG